MVLVLVSAGTDPSIMPSRMSRITLVQSGWLQVPHRVFDSWSAVWSSSLASWVIAVPRRLGGIIVFDFGRSTWGVASLETTTATQWPMG